MRLYDNTFSPFARKVRLVLDHKGIPYETVDGLALDHREDLRAVNPRMEVPVLVDDDFVVVDSALIVAYVEDRWPEPAVMPSGARERARARSWQRLADTRLDAIIHDVSLWLWPTVVRQDKPPEGLTEAAGRDLRAIYAKLDRALEGREFLCGELSLADYAVFPHLTAVKTLGVPIDPDAGPALYAWYQRMRELPVCRRDIERVRRDVQDLLSGGAARYETRRVFWRGDRVEWLLANGFHEWLLEEIREDRALWPEG